jgi:hypothetical protein
LKTNTQARDIVSFKIQGGNDGQENEKDRESQEGGNETEAGHCQKRSKKEGCQDQASQGEEELRSQDESRSGQGI